LSGGGVIASVVLLLALSVFGVTRWAVRNTRKKHLRRMSQQAAFGPRLP
jgi:Flp pilus assembly protein TadB